VPAYLDTASSRGPAPGLWAEPGVHAADLRAAEFARPHPEGLRGVRHGRLDAALVQHPGVDARGVPGVCGLGDLPRPSRLAGLAGVGILQPLHQVLENLLELALVAAHQHRVVQRVLAEPLDLLEVLAQDLELLDAGDDLAVGRAPDGFRKGARAHAGVTGGGPEGFRLRPA